LLIKKNLGSAMSQDKKGLILMVMGSKLLLYTGTNSFILTFKMISKHQDRYRSVKRRQQSWKSHNKCLPELGTATIIH
jgi:hypothetical protein